jgi:hypothetical protein
VTAKTYHFSVDLNTLSTDEILSVAQVLRLVDGLLEDGVAKAIYSSPPPGGIGKRVTYELGNGH